MLPALFSLGLFQIFRHFNDNANGGEYWSPLFRVYLLILGTTPGAINLSTVRIQHVFNSAHDGGIAHIPSCMHLLLRDAQCGKYGRSCGHGKPWVLGAFGMERFDFALSHQSEHTDDRLFKPSRCIVSILLISVCSW